MSALAVLAFVASIPFALWLFALRRPYVVVPALALAWWLLPAQAAPVYLALLGVGAFTHLLWGLARISQRRRSAGKALTIRAGGSVAAAPGVLPMYTGGATMRHQTAVPVHRPATTDEQISNYVSTYRPVLGPAVGVPND